MDIHNDGSTKVARQLSVMIQMSFRTPLVIMYSEANTMQVSISHCIVLYPSPVRLSTGSLTARSCRSPPPFQVDRQTLILTLDCLSLIFYATPTLSIFAVYFRLVLGCLFMLSRFFLSEGREEGRTDGWTDGLLVTTSGRT